MAGGAVRFWAKRRTAETSDQTRAITDLVRSCEQLVATLSQREAQQYWALPPREYFQRLSEYAVDPEPEQGVRLPFLTHFIGRGGDIIAALTAIGLACYAITWFGYSSFYGDLGIKPSEIGITYAYIVSRAAVGIAAFAFLGLLFLIPLALSTTFAPPYSSSWLAAVFLCVGPLYFGSWVLGHTDGNLGGTIGAAILFLGWVLTLKMGMILGAIVMYKAQESRSMAALATGITIVGFAALSWRWPASFDNGQGAIAAVLLLAILMVFVGSVFGLARWIPVLRWLLVRTGVAESGPPSIWSRFESRFDEISEFRVHNRVTAALIVFVLSIVFLVLANESSLSGSRAAQRIMQGNTSFGANAVMDSVLDLEAPKVEIKWVGANIPKGLPSKAIFIGTSGGTITLFAPSSCQPMRVPAGAVIMKQIDGDVDIGACPA